MARVFVYDFKTGEMLHAGSELHSYLSTCRKSLVLVHEYADGRDYYLFARYRMEKMPQGRWMNLGVSRFKIPKSEILELAKNNGAVS